MIPPCVPYLLQIVELHGHLSEEEVNVSSPLHGANKIWLYMDRQKREKGGGVERERVRKAEQEKMHEIYMGA